MSENITSEDVRILSEPTHTNVNKLAFDYSDGIIFNSSNVDPELKAYATQSDKPVTEYTTPEEYIENYATFFDQILESPAKNNFISYKNRETIVSLIFIFFYFFINACCHFQALARVSSIGTSAFHPNS